MQYRQCLAERIARDSQLESLQLPCAEYVLNPENVNNALVSTKWRMNLGQARSRKRPKLSLDSVEIKDDLLEFNESNFLTNLYKMRISITDLITASNRYPRPIDFTSNESPPRIELLENISERGFINEHVDFDKSVAEMSQKNYTNYQHHLPNNKNNSIETNSIYSKSSDVTTADTERE